MSLAATNDGPPEDDRAGPEKRPGAFRTISEVAEDLDVPQHVLRFWETRFSQIRPVKRAGGRRYYRPEDIDLLRGVRHLLHGQGYTIKGAQRILKESGVRFVQAVGRGEADVAAPPAQESEAEGGAGLSEPGEFLAETGRAAIEAALAELYACRNALAALRGPPEG
ncbi:MerR family transcriptional regulator [Methylobacterium planeticum]|uniref:MerR family transcriptional regulator n=1 Tax=Methylobacterium planeticum TaxID=2615211 RepID=A0A6N6MT63_9HYPH|nr:MerR family transcriptional regulator [Methylobacterium planeticum]KAB1075068.1 MerR family transcriptional regulator [Methylobacterium planeticum]